VTTRRQVVVAGHTGDVETARRGISATDAEVRASALAALDRAGALNDAELQSALEDADARVRRRAAQLAARYPGVPLQTALADADASVVEMAAFACGEREDSSADVVATLAELATGHADALVRESAVAALGAIGDERGLEAILTATHDKPAIRRRAVIALTPFEGPAVDDAMARALADKDWQVRQVAEDLGDGYAGQAP
jgi:HEAT repeat protein